MIGSAKYVDVLDVAAVGMRKKGQRMVIIPPMSEEQAQKWRLSSQQKHISYFVFFLISPPVPAGSRLIVTIECINLIVRSGG